MPKHEAAQPAILTSPARVEAAAAELVAGLSWDGPALLDRAPVQMDYEEEEGMHLQVQISASGKNDKKHALEALASVVGTDDAQLLMKRERTIMKWLRADPDHPAQFLANPLACLQMLDVTLSENAWQGLAKHRAALLKSSEPSAVSALRSLKVSMPADAPKRGA